VIRHKYAAKVERLDQILDKAAKSGKTVTVTCRDDDNAKRYRYVLYYRSKTRELNGISFKVRGSKVLVIPHVDPVLSME
jgi:hypothetical protein